MTHRDDFGGAEWRSRRARTRCRYVLGWLNYFSLSDTYTALLELAEWVRRRVRLYYWKQWKQSRTLRRHLLALGISKEEVHRATRSRKGYWRMSANSILQRALTHHRLHEHGVPDMRTLWIVLHYGPKAACRSEPPVADPHDRWCGTRELAYRVSSRGAD